MRTITHFKSVLLGAALSLGLAACSDDTAEVAPAGPRPAKVTTVTEGSNIQSVRLPLTVEALETTELSFQVGGQLQALELTEGQPVEAGQQIAQLDQRDFRSAVDSARATLDNAQIAFGRAEQLIVNGNIAQSVYDERQANVRVARANLETAQKALSDSTLTAPFDGVVADIYVEGFQSVSPQQPIVTLQSVGQMEAVVQMPASLSVNAQQIEPISTTVTLDVRPDVEIDATLREISQRSDPSTQTYAARFAFTPPPELNVLPGMTGFLDGRIRIRGDERFAGGVTLPINAIIGEGEETFVFVFDPETRLVSRREVTVGRGVVGEMVRIESGLAAGDQVVVSGAAYLVDGMEIVPMATDGAE